MGFCPDYQVPFSLTVRYPRLKKTVSYLTGRTGVPIRTYLPATCTEVGTLEAQMSLTTSVFVKGIGWRNKEVMLFSRSDPDYTE
jgi:hypothetical protein